MGVELPHKQVVPYWRVKSEACWIQQKQEMSKSTNVDQIIETAMARDKIGEQDHLDRPSNGPQAPQQHQDKVLPIVPLAWAQPREESMHGTKFATNDVTKNNASSHQPINKRKAPGMCANVYKLFDCLLESHPQKSADPMSESAFHDMWNCNKDLQSRAIAKHCQNFYVVSNELIPKYNKNSMFALLLK
jgi:hypothetical protein